MGRTISIRFKDNKVHKVSGRSAKEKREAEALGNVFLAAFDAKPKKPVAAGPISAPVDDGPEPR